MKCNDDGNDNEGEGSNQSMSILEKERKKVQSSYIKKRKTETSFRIYGDKVMKKK